MSKLQARIEQEIQALNNAYGHQTGSRASEQPDFKTISTGILSLDYALGTGGWRLGHLYEVFGVPDIGKSAAIGFSAVKQAQKEGLVCGWVALEPGFDEKWAEKNGVNTEELLIARPNHGDDAFRILHRWLAGDLVDFIIFDSVGAVLRASESGDDSNPAAMGQAALITWGVKNAAPLAFKNGKAVIFMNQVRDVKNPKGLPMLDSPGGHAREHMVTVRIQLKGSAIRHWVTENGAKVEAGREITAVVKRNKLYEGTGQTATFDFWSKSTDEMDVGVDAGKDIVSMAMTTGVVTRGGSMYAHPSFPDGKIQGKIPTYQFILGNEDVKAQIRKEVLDKMKAVRKDAPIKDAE